MPLDLFQAAAAPEVLQLYDYQAAAIESARDNIRAGHRRQILCAPTGAGKTIIGLGLMKAALEVGSRSAFVTDRNALIDQTSDALDRYGIEHGVLQAQHWRCRPDALVQVVSAQTLGRRLGNGGYVDNQLRNLKFVLIDECHSTYETTLKWLNGLPPSVAVIGLTATPFAKGLGQHYQAIVNVATTDDLVQVGRLVSPILYAAVEMDTSEVAVSSTGEWDDGGLERAGVKIVGDVVAEFSKRTTEHFDGAPVKTIVFSSTVAHGEEICRAFAEAGRNFQNISYRDDEDERKAKIAEFRRPGSLIQGLVSCDALAKGFDVPDVRVCILCRPLRKSLTTVVQQIGRVMRTAPGKDKALVIDHAGNCLRFYSDLRAFWRDGVDRLDESAEKDRKARASSGEKERKELLCLGCQAILVPGTTACLACGRERPRRPSNVTAIAGTTRLLSMSATGTRKFNVQKYPFLQDRAATFQVGLAFWENKSHPNAIGRASGFFHGVYGRWPDDSIKALPSRFDLLTAEAMGFCRSEWLRFVKSRRRPQHAAAA